MTDTPTEKEKQSARIKPNGLLIVLFFLLLLVSKTSIYAQSTGCVTGGFGIDAGLYSGVIEYGSGVEPASPRSNDWFQGAAGSGVNTFLLKTRASAAFTTSLKDIAEPFSWGQPRFDSEFDLISCDNETTQIPVNPERTDVNFLWATLDGNILKVQPYNPPLANFFCNSFLVDPNDVNNK